MKGVIDKGRGSWGFIVAPGTRGPSSRRVARAAQLQPYLRPEMNRDDRGDAKMQLPAARLLSLSLLRLLHGFKIYRLHDLERSVS